MATEIVYQTWCDVCLRADDRRTEVDFSADVSIDGKTPQHVDLCQRHAEPMIAATSLLNSYGTKAGGQTDHDDGVEHRCQICDKLLASRGSLTGHYRTMHDTTASVVEGTRPIREPKPIKCPDCPEVLNSPQGLGAHRRSKHGVMGSSTSTKHYHGRRQQQPILEETA